MPDTLAIRNFPSKELASYAEAIVLSTARARVDEDWVQTRRRDPSHLSRTEQIARWLRDDPVRRRHMFDLYISRIAPMVGIDDSESIPAEDVATTFADIIDEVKKSFESLFSSFGQALPLIPSEELRILSSRAALSLDEAGVDLDAWARKLVDDTSDADD